MKLKSAATIVLLALVCTLLPALLHATELQTALNGFKLWQFRNAVSSTMGKPFDSFERNDSIFEAYRLDDNAYMVFEYLKKYQNNVHSMQITGTSHRALPFLGLRPGDDLKKVVAMLGKPSRIERIESPRVSKYDYEGRNYTLEIDDKNRLYSIKIFMTKDILSVTSDLLKSWDEFKAAILAKDAKRIMAMLRPDVEIYKDGKVLSIDKRYADFVENPEKDFLAALLGEKDSVLKELAETEPEAELRLHEVVGVGEVYKEDT